MLLPSPKHQSLFTASTPHPHTALRCTPHHSQTTHSHINHFPAGRISPTHSPNPTPAFSQPPARITASPSSRNPLNSPLSPRGTFLVPFAVISNKLPMLCVSVPEMVPVPSKSPVRSGQPVTVWCAIICEKEKRRFEEEVWEILWVPDWAVVFLLVG